MDKVSMVDLTTYVVTAKYGKPALIMLLEAWQGDLPEAVVNELLRAAALSVASGELDWVNHPERINVEQVNFDGVVFSCVAEYRDKSYSYTRNIAEIKQREDEWEEEDGSFEDCEGE